MCRFAFYRGEPIRLSSLLTEPKNSLIHQSFESHEREEPLNGDGFGIAWYAEGHTEPAMFKSVTPAWNNENLLDLARVTKSGCMMAHVRAATQGIGVIQSNCHPFKRGKYTFMHNGDIGGFQEIRRSFLAELSDESFKAVRGNTDSEHFFALLMDELRQVQHPSESRRMLLATINAIRRVMGVIRKHLPEQDIYLNTMLTDGTEALAVRWSNDHEHYAESLYTHQGRRYICEGGLCRMVNTDSDNSALIISSEPLSDDPGWHPVPVNHAVLVHADFKTETVPLEI